MKKLALQQIRTLQNISAASGLVKIDGTFYIIADDELSLGVIEPNKETSLFPLVAGVLPEDHKERKKVKPDWEALALFRKKIFLLSFLRCLQAQSPTVKWAVSSR